LELFIVLGGDWGVWFEGHRVGPKVLDLPCYLDWWCTQWPNQTTVAKIIERSALSALLLWL